MKLAVTSSLISDRFVNARMRQCRPMMKKYGKPPPKKDDEPHPKAKELFSDTSALCCVKPYS